MAGRTSRENSRRLAAGATAKLAQEMHNALNCVPCHGIAKKGKIREDRPLQALSHGILCIVTRQD